LALSFNTMAAQLEADTSLRRIFYKELETQVAYSGPKLPPIPGESCHWFHGKAATRSTRKLPLIP